MLFAFLFCLALVLFPAVYIFAYNRALTLHSPKRQIIREKFTHSPTKQDSYYDLLLTNINNYDGTSRGQREVNR